MKRTIYVAYSVFIFIYIVARMHMISDRVKSGINVITGTADAIVLSAMALTLVLNFILRNEKDRFSGAFRWCAAIVVLLICSLFFTSGLANQIASWAIEIISSVGLAAGLIAAIRRMTKANKTQV